MTNESHVAYFDALRTAEMRSTYTFLIAKLEEKRPRGRSRNRWEIISE